MGDEMLVRTCGRQVAEIVATDGELRERLLCYAIRCFELDRATAEDLLQDALVDVLRSEAEIRSPEGFAIAVYRARCLHHVERSIGRRASLRGAPPSSTFSDDREAIVAAIALRSAFQQLSPSCQKLLRARYLEGRSLRETAAGLALAYSGVSTLVARCVRRLRLCIR